MSSYVLGYGWKTWFIPRSLIEASMALLENRNTLSKHLSRLLNQEDTVQYEDLKELHEELLNELLKSSSLEGLVGLQNPPMSGQIEGGSEPTEQNIHLFTVLVAAIYTIMTAWHESEKPQTIAGGN